MNIICNGIINYNIDFIINIYGITYNNKQFEILNDNISTTKCLPNENFLFGISTATHLDLVTAALLEYLI